MLRWSIERGRMGYGRMKVFSDVKGKKGLMYLNGLRVHRLRRILIVFNQTYGRFDTILLESLFLPVFVRELNLYGCWSKADVILI